MKHLLLVALLAASSMAMAAEKRADAPMKSASEPASALSQLKSACVAKLRPELKGAQRIRSIQDSPGKVDRDIMMTVSANGEKMKVYTCQVGTNGNLALTLKGGIEKSKKG